MDEDERTKVGRALDVLRNSLLPYVDSAMVAAYGDSWTDMVATEDATRRASTRKWIVKKSDLAVMLKAMLHRRIDPWQKLDQYPRVRGYASELLVQRNLYAHGDECINEHPRLLDTANRLLVALGLSIPPDLEPQSLDLVVRAIDVRPRVPFDLPAAEWTRLSESGQRLVAMWEVTDATLGIQLPEYEPVTVSSAGDSDRGQSYRDEYQRRLNDFWLLAGPKRVEMLAETYRLEVDRDELDPVMKVLPLATRVIVAYAPWVSEYEAALWARKAELAEQWLELEQLHPEQEPRGESRRQIESLRDELADVEARLDELFRLLPKESAPELWREVLRLAAGLHDGDKVPNLLILLGDMSLVNDLRHSDHAGWREEALPLARDAVARSRLLAAMDPGSKFEMYLISQLRVEGKLCNDLGLVDEAIRAFARADEIVDRYPAADPAHPSATFGK